MKRSARVAKVTLVSGGCEPLVPRGSSGPEGELDDDDTLSKFGKSKDLVNILSGAYFLLSRLTLCTGDVL